MERAALYLRLSKEDVDKIKKGDDSESIANQRLLLTDYAALHGFQIVDVYVDDDYSGLYDDRPEFNRLIKDGKLGMFDVVLAKSQSRFTRNMEHMERYLHHDFPFMGIRFIGVVDGVDTNEKGNKKTRQIYGLTNEWYCEDLSESIRSVFKQKMKAGQFLGGFAPYGYIKDPKDGHEFLVDETAAEIVRRIFHLYLQGYGVKQICHVLEDEGVPNPTVYKKRQGLTYSNAKAKEFSERYDLWSETTVKRILGNETYVGKLIQGTHRKISYKDKRVASVPKEEWIVVPNHHEPIVDSNLFYKVQSMREKRRVVSRNQKGDKKVHVFAGKLRCLNCGSTMIKSGGKRGKTDDWYLRCQLANKSRLEACTSHGILYSVVEQTVLSGIQTLVSPILKDDNEKKDLYRYVCSMTNGKGQVESKAKRRRELQTMLDTIAKSIQLLYYDRAKGSITEDRFLQLKDGFEQENERLEKQMESLRKEPEDGERNEPFENGIDPLIGKYFDFTQLTHEMVVDFIEYIEIGERDKQNNRQEITIHWNV